MVLHRTFLVSTMTSVTMQTASSTAVKKPQEYTKEILCVLPPVFYYVIEVLPNSEIPIVLRGHVSDKTTIYSVLYASQPKHRKHEIVLWNKLEN